MSILPHFYNNQQITQTSEDTVIAGNLIPKGYCSATDMCKANGKRWNDYKRLKSSVTYWKALSQSTGIPVDQLVIENESQGSNSERGTWVHPEIAIDMSQWVSVDFRIWANRVLRAVLNNEVKAQTEDAIKAKKELDALHEEIWKTARIIGKSARRSLTDACKDWYTRNPNSSSRPLAVMIAQSTNLVYQALWGMDAMQLEEHLGCGRHESRDHLSARDLKTLDAAEERVAGYIDQDNLKPVDAVPIARLLKSKQPPQRR